LLFAFSEEIRLRVLMLLARGSSLCVKCIVSTIDTPQPTVSRHLSILRRSGVVEVDKDEQHRYYSLKKSGPFVALSNGLMNVYQKSLKDKNPFKKDYERLKKIRSGCSVDCKVHD